MSRWHRIRVTLFLVCVAALSGCGAVASKPPATEDATAVRPSEKFETAIKIATLYFNDKEYDRAEAALQAAFTDPSVTPTAEAKALLDAIRTARRAGPVSATPPGSPQTPSPPIVAPPDVSSSLTNSPSEPSVSPPATSEPKPNPPGQTSVDVVIVEDQTEPEAPFVQTPATEAMIAKLEARLQTENEAINTLKIYERFVERHPLTAEQAKNFAPRLEKWRDLAGKKLVRWGTQWIAPELARQKKAEAEALIDQALTQIRLRNFKMVAELLEKASRIDPNAISAHFILGLLNSGAIGVNHPPTAEEHFRKVLVRSPQHISALNNLALTEIKLGKYPQALTHFTQAAEIAPSTPQLSQNIGRVIKEAAARKLIIPPTLLLKFAKLYAELTNPGTTSLSDKIRGWLYMPLYLPENERKGRPTKDVRNEGELVMTATGSGFVVYPGYVLTNRHVVRSEEFGVGELKIVDPTDDKHKRELPATVVAISADHDIALVKCDAIKSPAIPLSIAAPRRGTEIQMFGYPMWDVIGRGLKVTRGIVSALPEEANYGMLLFDAEINSGNSGGPVVDKTGAAIGVATTKYNAAIVGNYSGGVPVAKVIPFVKTILPSFVSASVSTVEKSWPDIDAQVAPSTVMLLCYYPSVAVSVNPAPSKGGSKVSGDFYEDFSCIVCQGSGVRACPNKRCVKGEVSRQEKYQENIGIAEKLIVNKTRLVKSDCPVCHGRDRVDCGACSAGRDTRFLGR